MNHQIPNYLKTRESICLVGVVSSLLLALLFIMDTNLWADVDHYWNNINDWYDHGLIPYKDYVFEYPPFSLVIFLIPRIFSWDLNSFHYSYAILCMITYVIAARCTLKMIDDENAKTYAMILLILIPLFSIRFIITRNDIFAVAGIIIALYLMKNNHKKASLVIIAIAAMIKIYPILVILPIIAYHLSKKDYKKITECLIIPILTCIIIEIPFLIIDPSSAFDYLSYHSDRNIQIESIAATIMYAAYALGLTSLHYDNSSGSENIVGELPDMISPYMNFILVIGLVLIFVMLVFLFKKNRIENNYLKTLIISFAIVILTFIVLNKVYSAQYMLWILGLMPLVIWAVRKEKDRKFTFILTILFGLSSAIAAKHYSGSNFLNPDFVILECIKNIFTIALLILCIHLLRKIASNNQED